MFVNCTPIVFVLSIGFLLFYDVQTTTRFKTDSLDIKEKITMDERTSCICVNRQQCINGYINTDGKGIIDPRKPNMNGEQKQCSPLQVCCKQKNATVLEDNLSHHADCGIRHTEHSFRITSSSISKFGDWPWHAAILSLAKNKTLFVCSGVLIDSKHVLTTAHCVYRSRLGEWDTQHANEEAPHKDYRVRAVKVHSRYNPNTLWNDIAILVLAKPAFPKVNIGPICLTQNALLQSSECYVTGWGKQHHEGGSYSAILKEAKVNVVKFDKCQQQLRSTQLGHQFKLHNSFLCAGSIGTQNDSCKGDGGGPLMCRGFDNLFYLIGLVSWGIGCGANEIPGVYVNVIRYVVWINRMINY